MTKYNVHVYFISRQRKKQVVMSMYNPSRNKEFVEKKIGGISDSFISLEVTKVRE